VPGDAIRSAPYVVLIGDLVRSRALADRAEVQRRLVEEVRTLNAGAPSGLAAPAALTAGDEVQAILSSPAAAVELVTGISDALRPVPLAWGLGRGEVTTDWSDAVSAMDGPCFHRARAAVEAAAQRGVWLRASGFSDTDDRLLSALFRLVGVLRFEWTDTQFSYVRALRDRTQREVADMFDRDETTVSRTLARAHVHDVLEGEEAARALLAEYGEGGARAAWDRAGKALLPTDEDVDEQAARARHTVRTT